MTEMIGYLGSVLVVVSMLMSSVVKLRVVNTLGSGIFAAYALMIHSYPTALMNLCLVGINLWNLARLRRSGHSFSLTPARAGDSLLDFLLTYYRQDIQKFFPDFPGQCQGADQAWVVCCGGVPAGILLGRQDGTGEFLAVLDYSTPAYRDCSIGTYLYAQLPAQGVRRLRYEGECAPKHAAYLRKMGFVQQPGGAYVKDLV